MQLNLLWNYMQYDMEADRFEAAMRNAPDRLKLLKQRDFLLEQQNNVKRIERETAAMSDRLEAVRDEAKRLQGLIRQNDSYCRKLFMGSSSSREKRNGDIAPEIDDVYSVDSDSYDR
jgi:hypothetical protein